MKRIVALLCTALSFAALSFAAQPAFAQLSIGGGAGVVYGRHGPYLYRGYGPYLYGGFVPFAMVDPWAAVPPVPRGPDTWPSCHRYGRCSPADVAAYRHRAERLERLAPSVPSGSDPYEPYGPQAAPPPPTAEEDIVPEFRASSVVKEEYRDSGRPVDGRQ